MSDTGMPTDKYYSFLIYVIMIIKMCGSPVGYKPFNMCWETFVPFLCSLLKHYYTINQSAEQVAIIICNNMYCSRLVPHELIRNITVILIMVLPLV